MCSLARPRTRVLLCQRVRGESGRERKPVNNFQSCVFPSYISARCVHTTLPRRIRKTVHSVRAIDHRVKGLRYRCIASGGCRSARFSREKICMHIAWARCAPHFLLTWIVDLHTSPKICRFAQSRVIKSPRSNFAPRRRSPNSESMIKTLASA